MVPRLVSKRLLSRAEQISSFEAELNVAVERFIRELAELARIAAYAMAARALDSADISQRGRRRSAPTSAPAAESAALFRAGLKRTVMDFERQCIEHALDKHGGNISHTASALRTTRASLQRKIRRLKVRR